MSSLTFILSLIVAVEHLYIMYLETFVTTSKRTAKTFNMSEYSLENPNVQVLFKNQGVYNGLIAISLLYGLFFSHQNTEIVAIFLFFVSIVAIYGGLTSSKSIILKQGGPAILALISLLFL
ncbi:MULTISPECIES: DUF1304 domain-containing protein [Lysinibacillus]|uniref:DUF1304 domain-containing protein n=1 Tax=Lysinibacillus TaxID=400634 RepID=UPI00257DA9D3|nr:MULTISPECIES: DUF1304 domain-containing protein [Lysinibacillus]